MNFKSQVKIFIKQICFKQSPGYFLFSWRTNPTKSCMLLKNLSPYSTSQCYI